MRKQLIPISLVLMPYLILLLIIFSEEILLAISLTLGIIVITIANFIYAIIYPKISNNVSDSLKWCMIIKLMHIPFYILLFVIGVASWLSFFLLPVAVIAFLIDCFVLITSSIYGVTGTIKLIKENQLSIGKGFLAIIGYFIFIIDLVTAVIMYLKVRKQIKN